MYFIELTTEHEKKVINVSSIVSFCARNNKTRIVLSGGTEPFVIVQESYEEVKTLLNSLGLLSNN